MTVAVPCADGGDIALYLPLAAVACSLIRVLLLVPVPPPPPFPSCHVMSSPLFHRPLLCLRLAREGMWVVMV